MMQNNNIDFQSSRFVSVFDETPLWSAPFGWSLLDHIDYKENITALDIGFGTGFPMTEIAMRLGNSCKIYGIDPWSEAIERAKKKIEIYGIKNIEIIEGFAESIPLKDSSVDLITSNNGINNADEMESIISECSRICGIGGQFIQTMNTEETFIEFYDVFEEVLSDLNLQKSIVKMKEHIHKKRPPLDAYIQLLNKYKFEENLLSLDEFKYIFTSGTAMFNHFFFQLAFVGAWMKVVERDNRDEVFANLERRLNKIAKEKGCLTMTVPFAVLDFRKV